MSGRNVSYLNRVVDSIGKIIRGDTKSPILEPIPISENSNKENVIKVVDCSAEKITWQCNACAAHPPLCVIF